MGGMRRAEPLEGRGVEACAVGCLKSGNSPQCSHSKQPCPNQRLGTHRSVRPQYGHAESSRGPFIVRVLIPLTSLCNHAQFLSANRAGLLGGSVCRRITRAKS